MSKEPNDAGQVVLELPLPPKELSPNARPHWSQKAKAVKAYRFHACLEALAALGRVRLHQPEWPAAEMQMVFYFKARRFTDPDNALASMKAAIDGIADAGVIANDSGLVHHPPEMRVDKARPRVEITITRAA